MGCSHAKVNLTKKIIADGRVQLYDQCLICGQRLGGARPQINIDLDKIPLFDYVQEELGSKQLRELNQDNLRAKSLQKHTEYENYILHDPQWQRIRKLVLERDAYLCQSCLSAKATQVHHLSYSFFADELAWQLKSVCYQCHCKIHHKYIEQGAA